MIAGSQVRTLVQLGLVEQVSQAGNLSSPRFRCLVRGELVSDVAKNCSNFKIDRFLYDRS